MIWRVLACVAMALMTLSSVTQLIAWMEASSPEEKSEAAVEIIERLRYLSRTVLVLAILLQSAVTMHIAVGTW